MKSTYSITHFILFIFISYFSFSQKGIKYPPLIFLKDSTSALSLEDWAIDSNNQVCKSSDFYKVGISYGEKKEVFFATKKQKKALLKKRNFHFFLNDSACDLTWKTINDTVFQLTIPKLYQNTSLKITESNQVIGSLLIVVFPKITINIVIVPCAIFKWSIDSLSREINQFYNTFNTQINFIVKSNFKSKLINYKESFDNPISGNDRYTKQMILLRDEYFSQFPDKEKKSYYLFITPDFNDTDLKSYMINKGMICFANASNSPFIYSLIKKELTRGIIGGDLVIDKVTKSQKKMLTRTEWESFLSHYNRFNFYDNYEDVRTNSGIVAYYFWEQDDKGNIKLKNNSFLNSIYRPFKKNHESYYLNVTNFLFYDLFTVYYKSFNLLHIFFFLIIILSFYLFYRKIKSSLGSLGIIKFSVKTVLIVISIYVSFLCYSFVNKGYHFFELKNGIVSGLYNYNLFKTIYAVGLNVNSFSIADKKNCSESFIKIKKKWFKKRIDNVLFFEGIINTKNKLISLNYKRSSVNIKLNDRQSRIAQGHYMILDLKKQNGILIGRKIYNHMGVDLTSKLELKDPVKRVLLFVNGYRPTSLGGDFENMFADIKHNGVEFPNSNNLVYGFDRFNYWHPWKQIDELFRKRINPNDIYFLDGHFSVATSNHKSVLNFSTLSGIYPKRCSNSKKHICYHTLGKSSFLIGKKQTNTIDLLAKKPNREGFNFRAENGKIAGRNLIQMLNELPNKSDNDTVFIVSHSMGYAYSQGLLSVIRGKINFGGFYIISPENGESGYVNSKEWKQIWQYGGNLSSLNPDPPCLQDGVAAQTKVSGLPIKNHIYIPEKYYKRKGFFESHFIGNYTWIFDIPKNQNGYIKQN